ncbi:MAG: ROK family protein [Melioribacteraceae bacterium]
MNPTQVVLGIDIGGTNTVFGLVDEKGNCYSKNQIPTEGQMPPELLLKRLFSIFNVEYKSFNGTYELVGVGVGAPSANYFTGTIDKPSNFNWGYVDIVKLINQYYSVPVAVSNDANVAAIGEMKFGAAIGLSNFIEITLGTGLGSGIVVDGNVVYGSHGFAGELGHIIFREEGRQCSCGRKGCLETYVSANGIKRTVFELLANHNDESELRDITFNNLTSKLIYKAATNGDTIAKLAFEITGKHLGLALSNSVAHLEPEAIILFGGLALAGELILTPTRESLEANLLSLYKGNTKVLQSSLMKSENGAILGAAAIMWNELMKKIQFLSVAAK